MQVDILLPPTTPQEMTNEATTTVTVECAPLSTVSSVDLYVNDVLLGSDSSAPFEISWPTYGLSAGTYDLKAVVHYRRPGGPRFMAAVGHLTVTFSGIPIEDEDEGQVVLFADTHDISAQEHVIYYGAGTAAQSVDSDANGTNYGSFQALSSSGSGAGVRSYGTEAEQGMIYAHKMQDEVQKHFAPTVDGSRLTLDPTAVDAEALANFLIDLGLADQA